MEPRPITDVLATHTPELMALPGVAGVYEGALPDGTPCIKVIVVNPPAGTRRRIPQRIEGHPVVIVESDEIHGMPDSTR